MTSRVVMAMTLLMASWRTCSSVSRMTSRVDDDVNFHARTLSGGRRTSCSMMLPPAGCSVNYVEMHFLSLICAICFAYFHDDVCTQSIHSSYTAFDISTEAPIPPADIPLTTSTQTQKNANGINIRLDLGHGLG